MKQDVWATDGTTGEDDLLGDVDSDARGIPGGRVLDGVSGQVATTGSENDASDGGVGEDSQIRPRGEGVDVGGARVRTRPIRGVNRGRCDESTPALAAIGVVVGGDTDVGESISPVADNRDNATKRFRDAYDGTQMKCSQAWVRDLQRARVTVARRNVLNITLGLNFSAGSSEVLALLHGSVEVVPAPDVTTVDHGGPFVNFNL